MAVNSILMGVSSFLVATGSVLFGIKNYCRLTSGVIAPILFFRPFPLVSKELLLEANGKPGSFCVWRYTFGLSDSNQTLGLDLGLGEQ